MEGQNYNLTLIFEIKNVELFDVVNGKSNSLYQGNLGVYELAEMKLYVLAIKDWRYSLNKSVPVMLES
jgi:hypothetical protein